MIKLKKIIWLKHRGKQEYRKKNYEGNNLFFSKTGINFYSKRDNNIKDAKDDKKKTKKNKINFSSKT